MKLRILLGLVGAYLVLCMLAGCVQRKLLFFPTHLDSEELAKGSSLSPWMIEGKQAGWCREVSPRARTWVFFHGNGGQAVHRAYALHCFSQQDNVYILEYPGYGMREGTPSKTHFDEAAIEVYKWLSARYPQGVCVIGESLGSGPACVVSQCVPAPKRIVLVVPFDKLVDVAQEKMPILPVKLIMLDRWNNVEALKGYAGPVDVYGATYDQVIPIEHARRLAESKPGAVFHEIACDHNGWSRGNQVDLRE